MLLQVEKPLTGIERYTRQLTLERERERVEKLERQCIGNPSYTLKEVRIVPLSHCQGRSSQAVHC
jgi:hypothetical protein